MIEFEVYTQEVFERNAIKIYFVLRQYGKTLLGNIGKSGRIEFSEINPEEVAYEDNPTIIMELDYFKLFGKAIIKALEKNDIKPEEESFIKGRLVATEKHLEDLRQLLKLGGKS